MQVPAQIDIRELHEFEPIVVLDLTDTESLKSTLEYYRKKTLSAGADEPDEQVLNYLSVDQNLDLLEVLRAYRPILLEEQKTPDQIISLYRAILRVSESRLNNFLSQYRKLIGQKPDIKVEAALTSLSFAMPDGYWGTDADLRNIYDLVDMCGLLNVES